MSPIKASLILPISVLSVGVMLTSSLMAYGAAVPGSDTPRTGITSQPSDQDDVDDLDDVDFYDDDDLLVDFGDDTDYLEWFDEMLDDLAEEDSDVAHPVGETEDTLVSTDDTFEEFFGSTDELDGLSIDEQDMVTPPSTDRGVTSLDKSGDFPAVLEHKIVGGERIRIKDAPWQVALVDRKRNNYRGQFCGGSVVAERWIVTAAHCVDDMKASRIRVVAGTAKLSGKKGVRVSKIIVHPKWNPSNARNDIALLQLRKPLKLREGRIETISIPKKAAKRGARAQITGWGATYYFDPTFSVGFTFSNEALFPSRLQGATVRVQSNALCSRELGRDFNKKTMMCAKSKEWMQDTCLGDSGGPLAVKRGKRWELAGVTSWGQGCAWTTAGVYTKVSTYSKWINRHIKK